MTGNVAAGSGGRESPAVLLGPLGAAALAQWSLSIHSGVRRLPGLVVSSSSVLIDRVLPRGVHSLGVGSSALLVALSTASLVFTCEMAPPKKPAMVDWLWKSGWAAKLYYSDRSEAKTPRAREKDNAVGKSPIPAFHRSRYRHLQPVLASQAQSVISSSVFESTLQCSPAVSSGEATKRASRPAGASWLFSETFQSARGRRRPP